jgi:hypothetical protein
MTVLDRQKMREEILDAELDRARERAAKVGRTLTCNQGMMAWGALAAEMHGSCTGEDLGGAGCLCECHDEHRGGVESGTAVEMGTDTTETS